jgi:hypothetical protein
VTLRLGKPKRPKAEGYNVSIDGDWFRTAAGPDAPVVIATRDSLAERQDQKASAFENVLDVGYAFSRNNLTGGEGLDWYPRISQLGQVVDRDAIRFWDSKNLLINEPDRGQQYSVTLALLARVFLTGAAELKDLATSSTFIYVGAGDTITWYSGWDNNTPQDSFVFSTDILRIEATTANAVWVLTDDGHLHYKPFDSDLFDEVYDLTEGSPNDIPLTNIWWVKDRLLAERTPASGTTLDGVISLVEGFVENVGTPGTPNYAISFITVDTSGSRFRHVVDAGVAIVVAVSDGSLRSYVPQSDTSGAAPILTIRGTSPTPNGEEPFVVGFVAGKVLYITLQDEQGVGTRTCRIYEAEVLSEQFDFIVGNAQLLRSWSRTTEDISITKKMPVSRDAAFWTMEEEGTADTSWSYNAISGGVYRTSEIFADVTAPIVFNSLFGVITTPGDPANDVLVQDINARHPFGYVISPNVNFGLNTPINWIAVTLEGQGLAEAGDQIELWISDDPEAIHDTDHFTWRLIAAINHPSQSGIEVPILGLQSNSLALQVKMYPTSGGSKSPVLTRFAVRGFPAHRDFLLDVPINVSDTVSMPGRMPYRIPGLGNVIHRDLLARSGDSVQVEVLDPPFTIGGVLDQVIEPVEYISDRGSVSRYCRVVVRGKFLEGTVLGTNAGLGIGDLGISLLGVEKVLEEV